MLIPMSREGQAEGFVRAAHMVRRSISSKAPRPPPLKAPQRSPTKIWARLYRKTWCPLHASRRAVCSRLAVRKVQAWQPGHGANMAHSRCLPQ